MPPRKILFLPSLLLASWLLLPSMCPAAPVDSVVVFNEIMYHPADPAEAGEFIELHNQMGINVDLSDWEITGGVNFTFPDGTVIPGGGYLVIAGTPAMIAGSLGPFTGTLSNAGETIRLRDKNRRLMDEMTYSDSGKWPVAADGAGVSLSKSNQDTSSEEAEHWTMSRQVGGTPVANNFPPPPTATTTSVIGLNSTWKYNNTGTDPGPTWTQAGYDDTQVGWQSGQAVFDYGNTAIYDDYPNGPPSVAGNMEITTVTIAAKSSEAITGGLAKAAINCINGSGLTVGTNGNPTTHGTTVANTMWMTNGSVLSPSDPLPADITFDLGSVQNLTSLHVWNYNEFGATNQSNGGARNVNISVRADTTSAFTSVGSFTFNQASGLSSEAGQTIPFIQAGVRQIKFDITTNWGASFGRVGLSEIKFYNDQPAQPPAPPLRRESMKSVLPNTGVNSNGTFITPGQRDPNYINLADGLGAFVQNGHPAWLALDSLSQWMGPTPNGTDNVPAISTTYRMNVDLTNWDKNTAAILLSAAADNSFDRIRVNGTVIPGITAPAFDRYYGPFSIPTANLVTGMNVFELDWTNAGGGPNPGGFRAKWDATGVPLVQPIVKTTLAANPITTRFRQKFTLNGNPTSTYTLRLEHIVDDGAVFYLNGQEILRHNLPSGTITNTTLASMEMLYPKFSGILTVPSTAFQVGENTLAVELHQASAGNADALFGATMRITETPAVPEAPPTLQLSEIASAAATAGAFFVEIANTGNASLSLNGYHLTSSTGATVALGNITLAAGARFAIDEATLGFRPLDGEKLFFSTPSGTSVLDGVIIKNHTQARTSAGVWQSASGPTPGTANTFSIPDSIVINEIMYEHAPLYAATGFTADPEEWIELYNRSASAVDVSGWSVKGGVDFVLPAATAIPAGGYLVVAKDATALSAKYPSITIVGNWNGTLSNSGDTVRIEDSAGNTVNEVRYFGSGRWDERASGGGSSLELKHSSMDNSQAEAWAASDETSKAAWQTITYSGVAAPPAGSNDPTAYNEFILGLISNGECLVDDISVFNNSTSTQVIQNGNFSAGNPATWRLLGTHGRSNVVVDGTNPALKIIATGPTEHMHNQVQTTLKNGASFIGLDPAHNYTISFKAKWQSGSPRLQSRLYFNRLSRQHILNIPVNNGTPGAVNSRVIATPLPTLHSLSHTPTIPQSGDSAMVSVSAANRIPVTSMTLHWLKDGVGTWNDVVMTVTSDGRYEGFIPSQTSASLVQFYVTALAANGTTVHLPASGAASRAMIRWSDGVAQPVPGHSMRILMPTADADSMHQLTNVMSNAFLPCTIVYRDSEVFYDASVRLKSSQRGRPGDSRLGFAIAFDPTQKLRGVHEGINMDRSAYGPGTTGSGFGQVDIVNQIFANRAGGIPSMYNDMIYLRAPRSLHNGSAQMTMAEYNDVYLDSQWDQGASSPTFKFDLIYFPLTTNDGTPEGLKLASPDDVRGVNIGQLTGASKEDYRWHYIIGNARKADDFSRMITLNQAFAQLTAGNASLMDAAIDIDQWLRASAFMALVNSDDSYSTGGLPHNIKLYVRPDDGRVLYLPWDGDFFKKDAAYTVEGNVDLQRIIAANPVWRRLFYGHLHDIMGTSYSAAYLTDWVNHLKTFNTAPGNWDEILTYVQARRNFVLSDCATKFPAVSFNITTNGGNNFSSANALATLQGQGWIDVRNIRLQGNETPLAVTWLNGNDWQISLPLGPGANPFTLEALDFQGNVVGTDVITITGTGSGVAAAAGNLVFSELHYHPLDPSPAEQLQGYLSDDDFEYFEVQNISATPINLSNCTFAAGVTYTFQFGTTIAPGGRLIVPRRAAAFDLRHPGVPVAAGYYEPTGNVLSNSGETIALIDAAGADIQRFTYDDNAPWVKPPDGAGPSLVLIAPQANPDHNNPLNWRASVANHGNPGSSDALPIPVNPLADDNGNGINNLLEYAVGGMPQMNLVGNSISLQRHLLADVLPVLEHSPDLNSWTPMADPSVSRSTGDGPNMEILTYSLDQLPLIEKRFIRFRFNSN